MRWPRSTVMSDQAYSVLLLLMHTKHTHKHTCSYSHSPHLTHKATSLVSPGVGLMKRGESHTPLNKHISLLLLSLIPLSLAQLLSLLRTEKCSLEMWPPPTNLLLSRAQFASIKALTPLLLRLPCSKSKQWFFSVLPPLLFYPPLFYLDVSPVLSHSFFDYMVSWLRCSLSLLIHS